MSWNGKEQESLGKAVEVLRSLSYFGLYSDVATAWRRIFELLSTNKDGVFSVLSQPSKTNVGTVNKTLYKRIIDNKRIKDVIKSAEDRSNKTFGSAGSILLSTLGKERFTKLKAIQWADIYL